MKKKLIGLFVVASILTSNVYATYAVDAHNVNAVEEKNETVVSEKKSSNNDSILLDDEESKEDKLDVANNKKEEMKVEDRKSDVETGEETLPLPKNIDETPTKKASNAIASKINWNLRIARSVNGNKSGKDYALSVRKVGDTNWMYPNVVAVDATVPYQYVNLEIETNVDYEFVLRFFSGDNLLEVKADHFKVTENGVIDSINNTSIIKNTLEDNQVVSEVLGYQKKTQLRNGIMLISETPEVLRDIKFYDKNNIETPIPSTGFMGEEALNFVVSDSEPYFYKLEKEGYKTAKGTIQKGSGFMELLFTDLENNIAEKNNMMSYIIKFEPNAPKPVGFSFKGLASETQIKVNNIAENITIDNHNVTVTFSDTDKIEANLTLEHKDYVPVEIKIEINKDGSIKILNLDAVTKVTRRVESDKSSILLQQVPNFIAIPDGNGRLISTTSLNNMYSGDNDVYPGGIKKSKFVITNPTNRRYRLIDYTVKPSEAYLKNRTTLRNDSTALRKYYELFNPSYVIKNGSAVHVFDFEKINGISLYDGLLKVYQVQNPNLKSLSDLDPNTIQKEIFDNKYEFFLEDWEGDKYADYAYEINAGKYAIKEFDTKMIDFAQYHLFMNGLYFTFDTNSLGELAMTSTLNNPLYKYSNYAKGNEATKNAVLNYFKSKGVLEPGETVSFENFAYVLAGDLIHDTYQPSLTEFDFDIELKYGIVGIDGYLFIDVNENGIFDANEKVLENTEVRLVKDGNIISKTTTDSQGYYQFADVPSGSYSVEFTIDKDYEITNINQNIDGNKFDKSGKVSVSVIDEDENYHLNGGIKLKKVDPVKPVDPVDPVKPVDPVDPVKPVDPVDPVKPVEPTKPVDPTLPNTGDNTTIFSMVTAGLLIAGTVFIVISRRKKTDI